MKLYAIKNRENIGQGLFARRNIKKDELIFKVDLSKLKTYSSSEIKNHPKNEHADYVGHGKYVVSNHPYSYINHSCDPNVYIKHDTISKSRFYAMQDIKAGEEFSYDYGVNAMDQIDKELCVIDCQCGAKNCRKRVSCCFLKQPLEIQRKYYQYLPPSIKRKYKDKFK